MFWGIVILFVAAFLILGYIIDKRTDRYKSNDDRKTKDQIEAVKDETQKHHNPANNNHFLP
ncbi:preprotein translocase subunit SecG [Bacillus tianshenii]|uniref:Preprotein translocase subunit SecG n=1 Tax=Sutcliffiella tianshenii TaxID=1463404 RepID=A0ABS2P2X8_9BACI|nr:hypothetical protein [Bacillus tianshenii]MBM7621219.1 preprotein translocase subunit SecG [Bacillus tianshenii]